jgi:hypothetical protein
MAMGGPVQQELRAPIGAGISRYKINFCDKNKEVDETAICRPGALTRRTSPSSTVKGYFFNKTQ